MAAFFARVGFKQGPEYDEEDVYDRRSGEVTNPQTNTVAQPTPLGATSPIPDTINRRVALADWLTAPQNMDFARATVNRVWAEFFGKGIVDPVDDIRVSNPPSNDKLLDDLARGFVQNGYDVKWLIRTICTSRTYQLSAVPTRSNINDTRHFSHALERRLPAEQALDTVDLVTGEIDRFGYMPVGTRADQVPDSHVSNYFLQVFGKPKREIACACERDLQPNLAQSLHMINGSDIQAKIAANDGWLHQQIRSGASDTEIINELYVRALSRYPTASELRLVLSYIHTGSPSAAPNSTASTHSSRSSLASAPSKDGQFYTARPTSPISRGMDSRSASDQMSNSTAAGSMDASTTNDKSMTSSDMGGPAMAPPVAATHGKLSDLAPRSHGKALANPPDTQARTAALEDFAWALLNSQQFLFNH
jgi:hypothetical protein